MRGNDGWYDIHSHMLPAVDDGAKDWDMTKEMLKIAYEEGTRNIFVTPHYDRQHKCTPSADTVKERFKKLEKLAEEVDKSLKVYLGTELYYNQEAGELLDSGMVLTMAGSEYVLVEFSPARDFNYIKNSLYQLQMEGYSPILAHIERYQCLNKNEARVAQLVEMGIYLQVNANSIIGGSGFGMKQYLKKLLKRRYIHFIGSDAHNTGTRPPRMRKCAEYIMKKCDESYAHKVLFENPKKLIRNEYI